jgi:hypothetical protein
VIVFQRAGRRVPNESFTFGGENIQIVKEYEYLGVIFSNSCLFRNAADSAKKKGLGAVASLWNLLPTSRVNSWETHRKLFNTIVSTAVLYSAHVGAIQYPDVLEKVQSQFLRRIFHLDFKTATYAMRLETDSPRLELTLWKLTLNFTIRLLQMGDTRIAKICYLELLKIADVDNKRYNWTSNLKDLLNQTGYHHLWPCRRSADLLCAKQPLLEVLRTILLQKDVDKATDKKHLSYTAGLTSGCRITDLLALGIKRARVFSQMRLNPNRFYWNNLLDELQHEDKCTFCNLDSPEDLFHFFVECRIHKSSQLRFLNPLQKLSISRENLLAALISLSLPEAKDLSTYCITSLNRRKLFLDLYLY